MAHGHQVESTGTLESSHPVGGGGGGDHQLLWIATMGMQACRNHNFFFFFFLGPHLWHMEVPQARGRIGAIAASLRHGLQQRWILNPLSKVRD